MAKLNMQHVREFVNTALEEDTMESPLARALLAALSALTSRALELPVASRHPHPTGPS